MDFITEEVIKKLLIIVGLVIGGTAFVVIRAIATFVDEKSSRGAIKALRKNPAKARKFATSLDMPYGAKDNFSAADFEQLSKLLRSVKSIGEYNLLYVTAFEVNQLLVFTEIPFVDFDVDVTGKSADINKKVYHNFLLTFDPKNERLRSFSNIHLSVQEKNHKEKFLPTLFSGKINQDNEPKGKWYGEKIERK